MTSGIKHTYEYVKEYIESQGYKLLSTEYLNDITKLTVMCPQCHIYDVTFNSFKRGTRCKKCVGNEKHSQEYIENKCAKRGYKLLNKYVNGKTKLILEDREGYLYSVTWDSFNQECNPLRFSKFNLYTIQNIKLWIETNAVGYELLSTEFKNATNNLQFKCPKGHKFSMSWHHLQRGCKCPVCTGKQVTPETCIATTDSWMVKYFVNKEDAYTHSYGSNDVVEVKCPHCGKEKKMMINKIHTRKSIQCSCGDGTSYPEKFIISMLDQLNIKYTKEYKPLWSYNKRYDFYLEDYNCIIECHGKQHYEQSTRGRSLEEEQENDKYKKQLALDNDIDYYIELDCRYSKLEYMKQSILNSELIKIINLNQINWLKCEEFALSNIVKQVCDYWREHNEINNEGLTTNDIGKVFKLNICTIIDYLNKGTKLKWCNYNPKEEIKKSSSKVGILNGKPVEIFKDGKSLGIFSSCAELERQSEELFGINMLQGGISSVCHGKQKTHRGYTFKYISKEEYEERIK